MAGNILHEVKLKNGHSVIIRNAAPSDAENMVNYLNKVGGESDNLLFGLNEFRLSVEEEEKYIENILEDNNTLMLITLSNNEIISVSQISAFKRKRISHNAEVSVSVRKDYWGLGLGTIIMNLLIDFAKENNDILNVCLSVNSNNIPAINLYKKVGFEIVGTHRRNFRIRNDFFDEILMDLYL